MSYGSPPKTPYGDQDFIKEDVTTPQQHSGAPPAMFNSNQRGAHQYPAQPPLQPNQSPYGRAMHPPSGPADPLDLRNLSKSLTPEDLLFMRSWRQDSFYYRVVPLAAIGTGALFYYYKTKNLRHKFRHYSLVALASFFIGKWSYKGELHRRLEASPSNTPFMQSLRRMFGIQSSMSEFSGDTTQGYSGDLYNRDQPVGWGYNDNQTSDGAPPRRPPLGLGPRNTLGQPSGYGQYNQEPAPDATYQPYQSDLGGFGTQSSAESPKQAYSYEELRARNRGLIQK